MRGTEILANEPDVQDENHFNRLPDESILLIFSFLNTRDRLHVLGSREKRMHTISRDDALWKPLCLREPNQQETYLEVYKRELQEQSRLNAHRYRKDAISATVNYYIKGFNERVNMALFLKYYGTQSYWPAKIEERYRNKDNINLNINLWKDLTYFSEYSRVEFNQGNSMGLDSLILFVSMEEKIDVLQEDFKNEMEHNISKAFTNRHQSPETYEINRRYAKIFLVGIYSDENKILTPREDFEKFARENNISNCFCVSVFERQKIDKMMSQINEAVIESYQIKPNHPEPTPQRKLK